MHFHIMGKPVYVVDNASGVIGWYPHAVTAVVIKTGSNAIVLIRLDSKGLSASVTFIG